MTTTTNETDRLYEQARAAKAASKELAKLSSEVKNRALLNLADALEAREDEIMAANRADLDLSQDAGLTGEMLGRLELSAGGFRSMVASVRSVASLPDPIGQMEDVRVLDNGLRIGRRRVPLGVIASIYESRPEVTVDIPSLCLKSGNAAFLRGGKEAINCNKTLAAIVRSAIAEEGVPPDAVQFVESTDRALVAELLKMDDWIDLIVPRGGGGLIEFVEKNASMPAITGGRGVNHIYVDRSADPDMAAEIIYNAKVQKPAVCNAVDGVLVHRSIAETGLPRIGAALASADVDLRCDPDSLRILLDGGVKPIRPAEESDWGYEFCALIASIRVVDGFDQALEHIDRYGSGHSEAIITNDYAAAQRFVNEVDAAAVFVNASMRFNDGAQFGLGAEVGISTDKLHARGPMGLREITSYKWVVMGDGQVRP